MCSSAILNKKKGASLLESVQRMATKVGNKFGKPVLSGEVEDTWVVKGLSISLPSRTLEKL